MRKKRKGLDEGKKGKYYLHCLAAPDQEKARNALPGRPRKMTRPKIGSVVVFLEDAVNDLVQNKVPKRSKGAALLIKLLSSLPFPIHVFPIGPRNLSLLDSYLLLVESSLKKSNYAFTTKDSLSNLGSRRNLEHSDLCEG